MKFTLGDPCDKVTFSRENARSLWLRTFVTPTFHYWKQQIFWEHKKAVTAVTHLIFCLKIGQTVFLFSLSMGKQSHRTEKH